MHPKLHFDMALPSGLVLTFVSEGNVARIGNCILDVELTEYILFVCDTRVHSRHTSEVGLGNVSD